MRLREDKAGTPWCNFRNNPVNRQRELGCTRGDCYIGGCHNRARKILTFIDGKWVDEVTGFTFKFHNSLTFGNGNQSEEKKK